MVTRQIKAEFIGDTRRFDKSIGRAQKRLDRFGGGLSRLAGPAKIATAVISGIGIASIKMAADFDRSLAEVKTLLPDLDDEGFGVLRQGVLDHLHLDARAVEQPGEARVVLCERRLVGKLNLRGRPTESFLAAAGQALGFEPPVAPNTTAGTAGRIALWLGPDEWWIVTPGPDPEAGPALAERLRGALADHCHAVTDVGESRTCIQLSGPRARTVLQKGCPLDLHPRVFQPATCAQTCLAKATVLIHHAGDDGPAFDVYVPLSFAEYLWAWLEDAGAEYGVAVVSS